MKKLILRVFVIGIACFPFLNSNAFSQESRLSNSGQLDVIMPNYHYEYVPDFTYEEVAERIQKMELEMDFELNERVFSFIQYFTVRNREYIKMVLARKEQYFPMYEEILKNRGMPSEIQFLSIVESGLDPKIKSPVGAMGLWQFMPATGREYGMLVNLDIDDRMDPEKSTEGAAKYLKALYKMFGNWEVALAAYNCGPGNVRKAIRKSGGKTTFWGIYDHLPKETRSYVPQFQAMLYILNHLEEHNLHLEEPSYPMEYEQIRFDKTFHLKTLASLTTVCLKELEKLNPSIKQGKVPESHRSMSIRVPKSKAFFIKENLASIGDSLSKATPVLLASTTPIETATKESSTQPTSTRIAYKVKSGDALGTIANRYGVTLTQIKQWNNLGSNLIKEGQILIIHSNSNLSTGKTIALNSDSPTSSKTYTVRPGDSLWMISQKHSLSIEQIKRLNNLNTTQIKPGQRLIVG